jgi:superfamily I DNA/RNA helicase
MNYKVIGPPGTGKTHTLLEKVKEYVDNGTPLARIGYFAFTRKAAYEARDRFLKEFPNLNKKDLKYFQTLHSFAFNYLGLREEDVIQEEHYRSIGETIGVRINYANYEKNEYNGIFTSNSEYLNIVNLARVKKISALDQLDHNEHLGKIERDKLDIISKEIDSYKKTYHLIDFTDMIQKFINCGHCPEFDVIFIDEAQDLSLIQWGMVKKLQEYSKDIYVAGDDDQAIFGWAGADVESFINFDAKEIPLTQSNRIPSEVQETALKIISKIDNRIDKTYKPRDELGSINLVFSINQLDMSKGTWLILARTNELIRGLIPILKKKGIYFESKSGRSISESLYRDILNWEKWRKGEKLNTIEITRIFERMNKQFKETLDKEFTLEEVGIKEKGSWYDVFTAVSPQMSAYIRSMRINGEDLRVPPRVKISTIHGAKGGEAENVALLQDQTANTLKASKKSISKQDEEHRVWYVGVTRAKQNLFLIRGKDRRKEYKI